MLAFLDLFHVFYLIPGFIGSKKTELVNDFETLPAKIYCTFMFALLFLIRHCFFFGLGLGLLDGHPVIYALHTVYVVDEFGDQVLFGCVAGLAIQCDHAKLRLDLGIEGTGRAVI